MPCSVHTSNYERPSESSGSAIDAVVLGAGGHGRELHWALTSMIDAGASARAIGFVDDREPDAALLERLGSRWLGPVDSFGSLDAHVVVGIGAPGSRAAAVARIAHFGRPTIDVLHPSVLIGPDVAWGVGFVACANVSVTTNVRFGDHVHLNRHVTVGHDCVVGDYVSLHPAAVLSGNVRVGAHTMVGAGAVILPGVSVGAHVQIGAGAVVTKDVADGLTVVGSPAQSLR